MICTQTDHPSADQYKTTQDEVHSQHFSRRIVNRFLDLIIINFENAASHKYVVQQAKGL